MVDKKQESWLVLRAQTGDREALEMLLKAIQEPLYRYLHRLTNDEMLAEDVLQEVFIIIYRKLIWLQEPTLFRSWAYRIASREAFKRLKTERRWAEQVRDEETLAAIPQPEPEAELKTELPRLVAQLSPASRAVIVLHYLHEMPLNEVAEVLGVALGTVKSRLGYGLETLRRFLRTEAEE
jgi:RNA polymerase sigma-70 factor (ECF subfamily)